MLFERMTVCSNKHKRRAHTACEFAVVGHDADIAMALGEPTPYLQVDGTLLGFRVRRLMQDQVPVRGTGGRERCLFLGALSQIAVIRCKDAVKEIRIGIVRLSAG